MIITVYVVLTDCPTTRVSWVAACMVLVNMWMLIASYNQQVSLQLAPHCLLMWCLHVLKCCKFVTIVHTVCTSVLPLLTVTFSIRVISAFEMHHVTLSSWMYVDLVQFFFSLLPWWCLLTLLTCLLDCKPIALFKRSWCICQHAVAADTTSACSLSDLTKVGPVLVAVHLNGLSFQ